MEVQPELVPAQEGRCSPRVAGVGGRRPKRA